MTDLLEIVELAKEYNAALIVVVLLTRIDPRTKDAADMLDYLKTQGLTVLRSRICERVAFRRATGEGATVEELDKDPQAVAEIKAFFDEVRP